MCNASNSPSSCLILRRQCNVVLEEINVSPRSRDKVKETDFVAIVLVTLLIIARLGYLLIEDAVYTCNGIFQGCVFESSTSVASNKSKFVDFERLQCFKLRVFFCVNFF